MTLYPASLNRNKPMLIMSNGSERGDFIPLDYITNGFGRIHDGIQVLKTYYPHNGKWSPDKRISEVTRDESITYAWDYEYEDYHPFNLFDPESDCSLQFTDIKRFGADIHLTITMDLALSDEDIEKVIRSLTPYGRIFLRINHECNGNWFRYNKYFSYKEVSNFFVRCQKITKSVSSNIFLVFCLSGDFFAKRLVVENLFLRLTEQEMGEALNAADYWSIDRYSSLHFSWPFAKELDRKNENTYFDNSIEDWWRIVEECLLGMTWHNGMQMKPLFINEFNTDSDVNGKEMQAKNIASVYGRLLKGDFPWLAGIAFYQFRDKGGLGLETGDSKQFSVNPCYDVYKGAVRDIKYRISIEDWQVWPHRSYITSWFNSDSVRGLCVRDVPGTDFVNNSGIPVFLVDDEQNWSRLEPGDKGLRKASEPFYLFIPPCTDQYGKLQFTHKIDDVKAFVNQATGGQ